MSKKKTHTPAETRTASESATPWQGPLTDEIIVVTRLEVEARQDYEPHAENPQVELRRWLRIDEKQAEDRIWLLDFEVASPQSGTPYRFLVHLFATVRERETEADSDDIASIVMAHLSGRLYSIAGEQLFAATVRGPWGPISLPPQGPSAGQAMRIKEGLADSCQEILLLLGREGSMLKTQLADRIGTDFDQAYSLVLVQGLIEEEDSRVRLRKPV